MKKLTCLLLLCSLGLFILGAEGMREVPNLYPTSEKEPVTVRVSALKGPTSMGMVALMQESQKGVMDDNAYTFSIHASIDEVTPKLIKGDVDFAAVPANLASVLFNNTKGAVKVLAINTLGVLYLVENGISLTSIEDLRGKTVYASGKGATPEYVLTYLLKAYGIPDVTVEWKSEQAECVAALNRTPNGIAMLPQPFATTAIMKQPSIRIALDMTKLWDELQQGSPSPSTLVTGVVVGRSAFIEENLEAVSHFLDHYKDSVTFVQGNFIEASDLIESFGIVPSAVAKKALPYCNITFIEGSEMQTKLSGYLSVLFNQNPKSIGGSLPTDEFYFSR